MDKVKKFVLPCFEEEDRDNVLKDTLKPQVKEEYNLSGTQFSEMGFDKFGVKYYNDFMKTFDLELVHKPELVKSKYIIGMYDGFFEFRSKTNDLVVFTSGCKFDEKGAYFHYFGCSGTLEKVLKMFMYGMSDKSYNEGVCWGGRAFC